MSDAADLDVAAAYERSVNGWLAVVGGPIADWAAPTPCADWDVRTLVNHVVGEDRWTTPLVDGRTIAEVGDSLDGDLLGDLPVDAARAAAEDALTAVRVRLPEQPRVHLSYGDEDLAEYLWQLTADHLIHGWDLAAASGQDRSLDDLVVNAVTRWFGEREGLYRSAGAIADRPAATGQSAADELLIAFGRDPQWTAPSA